VVEAGPFARAFLLLIVVPLTAAALVQALARRHRSGAVIKRTVLALMGPAMMATLFTVVASQASAVGDSARQLLVLLPICAGFLVRLIPRLVPRELGSIEPEEATSSSRRERGPAVASWWAPRPSARG